MFGVNKSLVATAAVLAIGVVALVDMTQSHAVTALSPASVVSARFPIAAEMLSALPQPAPQAAPAPSAAPAGDCAREHWPYLADECLTDAPVSRPVRTISIRHQAAPPAPAKSPVVIRTAQLSAR